MSQNKQLGFDTVCIHGGHQLDAKRAHLTPIYATSTAGATSTTSSTSTTAFYCYQVFDTKCFFLVFLEINVFFDGIISNQGKNSSYK